MSPHIQALVVFLEKGEEVAGPVLPGGPITRQDVGLPEQRGHLGDGDRGTGRRDGEGDVVGDAEQAVEVLVAESPSAEALQNGGRHDWLRQRKWTGLAAGHKRVTF